MGKILASRINLFINSFSPWRPSSSWRCGLPSPQLDPCCTSMPDKKNKPPSPSPLIFAPTAAYALVAPAQPTPLALTRPTAAVQETLVSLESCALPGPAFHSTSLPPEALPAMTRAVSARCATATIHASLFRSRLILHAVASTRQPAPPVSFASTASASHSTLAQMPTAAVTQPWLAIPATGAWRANALPSPLARTLLFATLRLIVPCGRAATMAFAPA